MLKMILYAMTLITILSLVCFLIKEKGYYSREIYTCYECGFESKIRSRIPFSLHFFMLTIVYLLFDVEILVAFSFVYSIFFNTSVFYFSLFMLFCLITIYLEWFEGSLNWVR